MPVTAAPVSSLNLVIIEPDPTLRMWLKDVLVNHHGHHVLATASTGTDLVRVVLGLRPDVLVCDLRLPGMSGLEAVRQTAIECPTAAVVLTSSREEDQHEVRGALGDCFHAHLVKPVAAHQLEPAVRGAWAFFCRTRQLQDENASLRHSLTNRKVIERAKGVLMRRHHWSEPVAYRHLQRAAMNDRTTIVQLAQEILNGHDISPGNRGPGRPLQLLHS
jgi:response regulator NasT